VKQGESDWHDDVEMGDYLSMMQQQTSASDERRLQATDSVTPTAERSPLIVDDSGSCVPPSAAVNSADDDEKFSTSAASYCQASVICRTSTDDSGPSAGSMQHASSDDTSGHRTAAPAETATELDSGSSVPYQRADVRYSGY